MIDNYLHAKQDFEQWMDSMFKPERAAKEKTA
jgi:hypothetical protein